MGWLLLLASALSSTSTLAVDPPNRGRVELRVATGAEWDTNARRSVAGADTDPAANAARPAVVVSDGLMRLLLDASGQFQLGDRHLLALGYTMGAKRFFAEGTEDLWAHDLGLSTRHQLASIFSAGLSANLRASRIRNGSRDYWLGMSGVQAELTPLDQLSFDLVASYLWFGFRSDDHFDYGGPRAGVGATYRPIPRLAISLHGDLIYRRYAGNGLVVATATLPNPDGSFPRLPYPIYCETPGELPDNYTCTPRLRRDTEVQLAAGVTYRGGILVGGQYLLRRQRSTSELENVDRHRLTLFGTVGLPLDLTLSGLAALQINTGASLTDNRFLAEDDENQNSLQLQLRRPLFEGLSIEARYALFANQFSTAAANFVRHTVYLGVSYRVGLLDGALDDGS
ncbi:MAG: hypothetical protein IPG45_34825 [Deltaproteobacteria bacterium]|nr:hypothetical protein [Deltaproteobacteria bacterium]